MTALEQFISVFCCIHVHYNQLNYIRVCFCLFPWSGSSSGGRGRNGEGGGGSSGAHRATSAARHSPAGPAASCCPAAGT